MRKVMTYRWVRLEGEKHVSKIEDVEGIFIQFGMNFVEFENGVGSYTTAVVEMPNGTVRNLPVDMVRFINPLESVVLSDKTSRKVTSVVDLSDTISFNDGLDD